MRLVASTSCWVKFGEYQPVAVAGEGLYLPAGVVKTWRVPVGYEVAAIRDTTTGWLSVAVVGLTTVRELPPRRRAAGRRHARCAIRLAKLVDEEDFPGDDEGIEDAVLGVIGECIRVAAIRASSLAAQRV